ncbi:MAG: SURF1 family protein [Steroidobacteraceae bacterium]
MKSAKGAWLSVLCLFGVLLFTGLGIWQVQRLFWKRDLIARVETRIHLPPAMLPTQREWATLNFSDAEYRRVQVRGVFLHDRETWVDALTERGPGAWILTPVATQEGVVLVNRGFVPPDRRDAGTRIDGQIAGEVMITGLLRLSEPKGRILRPNDPAADRWFSRDVAAIAARRGLTNVAPFFIDADATPNRGGLPVGGLTVVAFRNAHLAYAITWFLLAVMCVAGFILVGSNKPGYIR